MGGCFHSNSAKVTFHEVTATNMKRANMHAQIDRNVIVIIISDEHKCRNKVRAYTCEWTMMGQKYMHVCECELDECAR